jgi:hypothetical protein
MLARQSSLYGVLGDFRTRERRFIHSSGVVSEATPEKVPHRIGRCGAQSRIPMFDLDVGQFVMQGQGSPSSRYGEVFLSGVDAQCGFNKLFRIKAQFRLPRSAREWPGERFD